MKTIILMTMILYSFTGLAKPLLSDFVGNKYQEDCLLHYQQISNSNKSVDCNSVTEKQLKNDFYQKVVFERKSCRDTVKYNDYQASVILAEQEYLIDVCLKKYLSDYPDIRAKWNNELEVFKTRYNLKK